MSDPEDFSPNPPGKDPAPAGTSQGAVGTWAALGICGVFVLGVVILGRTMGVRRIGNTPGVSADDEAGETLAVQTQPNEPAEVSSPLPTDTAGLIEEVRREIAAARRLYPDDLDAREMEARFLDWVGKSEEAVAIWQECLRKNPQYPHAYVGLASVAFKRGQYEQSVMWARQAIGLDPNYYRARDICAEALLNLGRPLEALEVLEEYLVRDPRAHGLFLVGRAYTLLQDWEKARRAYEAAVRKYPDYTEAYYALSRICLRMGDRAVGEKLLAKYWELMKKRDLHVEGMPIATDFQEASVNAAIIESDLGRIHLARGQRKEAVRLWRRAMAIDPRHLAAREMLAELALQEGSPDEAIRLYRELMEMDPMSLQYPLRLAGVLSQTQKLHEAETVLQAFCQRWPERPEAHLALAQFYLRVAHRPQEAVQVATTLVALRGSAADYALLAQGLYEAGDRQGAEKALQKAMELAPGRPEWAKLREIFSRDPKSP